MIVFLLAPSNKISPMPTNLPTSGSGAYSANVGYLVNSNIVQLTITGGPAACSWTSS